MNTLLFINANFCDVQIVEIICKTVVLMTVIIAVFYFFVQLSRIILDWKKSKLLNEKDVKSENGEAPDAKEEERKLELQRQDRAKALVKDFYEVTKDKDQKKDLDTAEKLLKMYKTVLGNNLNNTNVNADGE